MNIYQYGLLSCKVSKDWQPVMCKSTVNKAGYPLLELKKILAYNAKKAKGLTNIAAVFLLL